MNIIEYIKNKFSKPTLRYFNVNLVDHCNLNCKYCDHFSPVSKEFYIEVDKLEKDFRKMSSLVNINAVGLMGGEPLLHPKLPEILEMSRKVLPKTHLTVFTNGILLPIQKEEFWLACKKNNISIGISRYPIKLNLTKIFSLGEKYGVKIFFYGGTIDKYKTMFKLALDLEGKQDAAEMSRICWQNKGGCSFFGDGKLFQCTTAGHIHRLSDYFNLGLYVSEEDYIDIYKAKNGQEIIDFYKKVIPFCKHCDIRNQKENLPFEISKKEVSEWV